MNFLSIDDAMNNGCESVSARRSHSSLPNDILSRIESVIPRLFTKNITLRKDFAFKFGVRAISWKQIGIATNAGYVLGFNDGFYLLSCLDYSGVVYDRSNGAYECLTLLDIKYMKILVLGTKSFCVIMDQVSMH